jgi:hypothetical protein
MRCSQRYFEKGKRTSGRRSNTVSRQQMCHSGHAVRKVYGNLEGKWEMGQESE